MNHLGTQKIIHVHTILISNYFAFVKSGLWVRLNVTFFLRPNTIYFFTFNSSGGGRGGGAGGWGWRDFSIMAYTVEAPPFIADSVGTLS